jgi:hypothetical protein
LPLRNQGVILENKSLDNVSLLRGSNTLFAKEGFKKVIGSLTDDE